MYFITCKTDGIFQTFYLPSCVCYRLGLGGDGKENTPDKEGTAALELAKTLSILLSLLGFKRKSVPSFISGLPAIAILNSNLRGLCKTESVWKINLFLLPYCVVSGGTWLPNSKSVPAVRCARSYTCSSRALGLLQELLCLLLLAFSTSNYSHYTIKHVLQKPKVALSPIARLLNRHIHLTSLFAAIYAGFLNHPTMTGLGLKNLDIFLHLRCDESVPSHCIFNWGCLMVSLVPSPVVQRRGLLRNWLGPWLSQEWKNTGLE